MLTIPCLVPIPNSLTCTCPNYLPLCLLLNILVGLLPLQLHCFHQYIQLQQSRGLCEPSRSSITLFTCSVHWLCECPSPDYYDLFGLLWEFVIFTRKQFSLYTKYWSTTLLSSINPWCVRSLSLCLYFSPYKQANELLLWLQIHELSPVFRFREDATSWEGCCSEACCLQAFLQLLALPKVSARLQRHLFPNNHLPTGDWANQAKSHSVGIAAGWPSNTDCSNDSKSHTGSLLWNDASCILMTAIFLRIEWILLNSSIWLSYIYAITELSSVSSSSASSDLVSIALNWTCRMPGRIPCLRRWKGMQNITRIVTMQQRAKLRGGMVSAVACHLTGTAGGNTGKRKWKAASSRGATTSALTLAALWRGRWRRRQTARLLRSCTVVSTTTWSRASLVPRGSHCCRQAQMLWCVTRMVLTTWRRRSRDEDNQEFRFFVPVLKSS